MTKKHARSRILEVAVTEMLGSGATGTGLNQILRASGLSKGAFYHHFNSGEELTGALIRENIATHLTRTWIKPLERSRQSFTDLKRISFNELDKILDRRESFFELFLLLLQSKRELSSENQQEVDSLLSSWLAVIERSFRNAYKRGEIELRDEKEWPWLLLGTLQATMQLALNSGGKLQSRGVLRTFFAALES